MSNKVTTAARDHSSRHPVIIAVAASAACKAVKSPKSAGAEPTSCSADKVQAAANMMVVKAVDALREKRSFSLHAIKKYIGWLYHVDVEKLPFVSNIRKALMKQVEDGTLTRIKGIGATGSFKLTVKPKPAKKKLANKAKSQRLTKPGKKAKKPKSHHETAALEEDVAPALVETPVGVAAAWYGRAPSRLVDDISLDHNYSFPSMCDTLFETQSNAIIFTPTSPPRQKSEAVENSEERGIEGWSLHDELFEFDNGWSLHDELSDNDNLDTPTSPPSPRQKSEAVENSDDELFDNDDLDKPMDEDALLKDLMGMIAETAVDSWPVSAMTDKLNEWNEYKVELISPKQQPIEPNTEDEDQDDPQFIEFESIPEIISVVGNATSYVDQSSVIEEEKKEIKEQEIDQDSVGSSMSSVMKNADVDVVFNPAKFQSPSKETDVDVVVNPAKFQSPSKETDVDVVDDLSVAKSYQEQNVGLELPETLLSSEEVVETVSEASTGSENVEGIILETSTMTSSKDSSAVELPLEQKLEENELFPSVPDENTDVIWKSPHPSSVTVEVINKDYSKKRKLSNDTDEEHETNHQEVNQKASKRTKQEENGSKEEDKCTESENGNTEDHNDETHTHAECRQQQKLLAREIELLRGKVDSLQMRIEDLTHVEFGTKFKTLFHTKEKLLDMGKQRVVSNPDQVLGPGSSYLIGILLELISQKATENEKAAGESLILNEADAEIKTVEEKEYIKSETFNTDVVSVNKSVPSQTETLSSSISLCESLSKLVSNQKASSSSSQNGTNIKFKRPNLLDRPTRPMNSPTLKSSLNNSQTNKTGHEQSSMGLQTHRSIQKSSLPSTTTRQMELRTKICGVCGDKYFSGLLNIHANLHAEICFECHVCKVLHPEYQKAQYCIRAHGFDQVRPIQAFAKNDNGKLTAIGQEEINRLRDRTIIKITINQQNDDEKGDYVSNPQLLDHHHQHMMQRAVQPIKNTSVRQIMHRNLINQQMPKKESIERLQQELVIQRQQLLQKRKMYNGRYDPKP